jgi:hypothetical protein
MSEKPSRGKKREITMEEISRYIHRGYYFRVKEVNGIKYITRRKGREERSLGRYTEEVWSMIERARNQTDEAIGDKPVETTVEKPVEITSPDTVGLLEQLKEEVSLSKGLIMFINCLHKVEGVCTYWHWESKPGFFDTLDKLDGQDQSSYMLTDIVNEGRVEKRWTVKAQGIFCLNCPSYVSVRDIAFVEAFQFLKDE